MTDKLYMERALALAAQAQYSAAPNPMVGCVIVRDQQIVGEGWHRRAGEAHAEVHALQQAGAAAKGATVYVTLEPCSHFGRTPPCANALIEAEVAEVVVAMVDPNPQVAGRGLAALEAAGIKTKVGVCEAQARWLIRGFVSRMTRSRPWLQVKMASSLDGNIALANGESQWLTGPDARADVHRFRARSSAVLSTAKTVLCDQAKLTARAPETVQQPLRVVLDRSLQLTPEAALFAQTGPILLVHDQALQPNAEVVWPQHVEHFGVAADGQGLDLEALWQELARREINIVWTECGATLAGRLIEQGWADELIVYLAPQVLGHQAQSMLQLPNYSELQQTPKFKFTETRLIGADLRLIAIPDNGRGDLES
ncbi:bifunctional diaminohydroxyphosphoribosylaminopyrimidine deaminase/5-amino-6-(5-phosphoribosylamino)uracil reductase RibD [Pseudidiomarina taiwanensis]|uniref:Riboflavin biosynthesis protein RibD n=1 Tax=Pseudidiomarina taiwanensis TaxID=337250 RepID=A0A432ZNY4_9GAMM|nr:bifunctional diaminohydroxyphosphoribosylaminopyrimidine deaminase/5-amino-6-(5-phosphoribosylamino)uracil reductase RibD [Pseudidiomarina taiwanensis]RUO79609.1 riboflavin biosynthesis protein RibD [Pseudidiomarina taiwanensis]